MRALIGTGEYLLRLNGSDEVSEGVSYVFLTNWSLFGEIEPLIMDPSPDLLLNSRLGLVRNIIIVHSFICNYDRAAAPRFTCDVVKTATTGALLLSHDDREYHGLCCFVTLIFCYNQSVTQVSLLLLLSVLREVVASLILWKNGQENCF